MSSEPPSFACLPACDWAACAARYSRLPSESATCKLQHRFLLPCQKFHPQLLCIRRAPPWLLRLDGETESALGSHGPTRSIWINGMQNSVISVRLCCVLPRAYPVYSISLNLMHTIESNAHLCFKRLDFGHSKCVPEVGTLRVVPAIQVSPPPRPI